MGAVKWEDISEGKEVTPLVKKSTFQLLFMFSAITWNRHLIHFNTEFARNDGLPDVATHRALIGNLIAQMFGNWVGDAGRLARLEWVVKNTAIPGDTLTCKGKVIGKRDEGKGKFVDCDIWVENQKEELIANGKGSVLLWP